MCSWACWGAGGITAGVPGLADILQEDLSADYSAREAQSEPPPRASTPKQVLAAARSAPPIMALTPLTEETEADLRSTSHAYGQSGTNGHLGTGFLSTAGQGECHSRTAVHSRHILHVYPPSQMPQHRCACCKHIVLRSVTLSTGLSC